MGLNRKANVIRACYAAWESDDRAMLEPLLADGFTFSSPNDDALSKDEYWEVCWANSGNIRKIELLNIMVDGDSAFARYNCELQDGTRFRNAEFFRFDGNQIAAVEVYFGRHQSGEGDA